MKDRALLTQKTPSLAFTGLQTSAACAATSQSAHFARWLLVLWRKTSLAWAFLIPLFNSMSTSLCIELTLPLCHQTPAAWHPFFSSPSGLDIAISWKYCRTIGPISEQLIGQRQPVMLRASQQLCHFSLASIHIHQDTDARQ